MRRITIEFGIDGNGCAGANVINEYGQETGRMTVGEVLEHVASMLISAGCSVPTYQMQTPEEWEAQRQRRDAERAARVTAKPIPI